MAGYVIFYEILILSMLQKKRLNNHYNEFIIIIIIYILKIKKLKNYIIKKLNFLTLDNKLIKIS